jgi:hypothetical protein
MSDILTYQNVCQNWQTYEEFLVTSYFAKKDEKTYKDLITRVTSWCLNSKRMHDTLPENLYQISQDAKHLLEWSLHSNHIVPSVPILKHGGTGEGTYFASVALGDFDFSLKEKFELIKDIYDFSATCGANFKTGFPSDRAYDVFFDDTTRAVSAIAKRKGSFATVLSSRVSDWEYYIFSPHKKGIAPVLEIDEDDKERRSYVLSKVAESLVLGNNVGCFFRKNYQDQTPIPLPLNPGKLSALPGYIGLAETSPPVLYVNVAEIMRGAENYEEYLKRVSMISSRATLLANILLYQQEGYLSDMLRENTLKHRPICIGITGLHGAMIRCDVDYESDEGLQLAKETQAALLLGTLKQSAQIMITSTKHQRIGCRAENIWKAADTSADLLKDSFDSFGLLNDLKNAMEKHGCIYNIVTTAQCSDPQASSLIHSMTPGVGPLSSIERQISLEKDGEKISLVPKEIFDEAGEMTCDLSLLHQQTSPYIAPEFQLQFVSEMQRFCHGGIHRVISCPKSFGEETIIRLLNQAEGLGISHLSLSVGDYEILERDVVSAQEEEPEVVKLEAEESKIEPPPIMEEMTITRDEEDEIEVGEKQVALECSVEAEPVVIETLCVGEGTKMYVLNDYMNRVAVRVVILCRNNNPYNIVIESPIPEHVALAKLLSMLLLHVNLDDLDLELLIGGISGQEIFMWEGRVFRSVPQALSFFLMHGRKKD